MVRPCRTDISVISVLMSLASINQNAVLNRGYTNIGKLKTDQIASIIIALLVKANKKIGSGSILSLVPFWIFLKRMTRPPLLRMIRISTRMNKVA